VSARELEALAANEEQILEGLRLAYNRGELDYLHFSPAWDVTIARMTALRALSEKTP
jgi:hypothetical protein